VWGKGLKNDKGGVEKGGESLQEPGKTRGLGGGLCPIPEEERRAFILLDQTHKTQTGEGKTNEESDAGLVLKGDVLSKSQRMKKGRLYLETE